MPVGADQKQHLELTRDLAIRFNRQYHDIFTVPEPFIPKRAGRIMGLQDPESKMSKSDPVEGNYIALLDPPAAITKKLKRCVTDSEKEIRFDMTKKAGISNLLTLYSSLTGLSVTDLETRYAGQGYGTFKAEVSEALITLLTPIQERFQKLRTDEGYLRDILRNGAKKASAKASITLAEVYDAIGFIPR